MLSLLSLLFTLGCSMSSALTASAPPRQAATPAIADPFPTPREGLKLSATTAEGGQSLLEMLSEFTRVTGQALVIDPSARAALQAPTGLNQTIAVPPAEVYFVVETLLVQHGFVLVQLSEREPRMLAVHMRNGPDAGTLRGRAVFVRPEALASYARHPALLITTTVELPSTDVRTLSNSMRAMLTDAAIQQMIPVGNTSSLLLTGSGSQIAGLVETLRAADEAARREFERRMVDERSAAKAMRDEKPKEETPGDPQKPR